MWKDNLFRLRHYHTHLAIACSALATLQFRAEMGTLPNSLEQLVPAYLDTIPPDFFGEGPLRYLRTDEGAVIYSVWINGTDEGGNSDGDRTFRVIVNP